MKTPIILKEFDFQWKLLWKLWNPTSWIHQCTPFISMFAHHHSRCWSRPRVEDHHSHELFISRHRTTSVLRSHVNCLVNWTRSAAGGRCSFMMSTWRWPVRSLTWCVSVYGLRGWCWLLWMGVCFWYFLQLRCGIIFWFHSLKARLDNWTWSAASGRCSVMTYVLVLIWWLDV